MKMQMGTIYGVNYTTPRWNGQSNDDGFTVDQLLLITNGFTLALIAFLGMIGNTLSIVVLVQPRMRSFSMNKLLIGLQISDLLVVIAMMLFMGVRVIVDHYEIADTYRNYYLPFIDIIFYPLAFTAETASHFFTVLITLERYVAVCVPLRAKSFCSSRRTLISSVLVTIFAIIYGLPLWFERRVSFNEEKSRYDVVRTEMDLSDDYNKYFTAYGTLVILYLIPFSVLIVCNTAIYKEVRKSKNTRGKLNLSTRSQSSSKNNMENNSLSFLLFAIVITFIFCNMFQLISNILRFVFKQENSGFFIWCLDPFRKLLITLNSSVNFLFYCVFGKRFRTELLKLIKCNFTPKRTSRNVFKSKGRSSSEKTIVSNVQVDLNHQLANTI